jgi:hypothetical protein
MLTVGKISSADLCSCRFARENRHRKLFDGHGLDTGLFRPSKKICQRVGWRKQGLLWIVAAQTLAAYTHMWIWQRARACASYGFDLAWSETWTRDCRQWMRQRAACRASRMGAFHEDSPRGIDSASQRPRCALRSHGYGAGRKWRRVLRASPTRKIPKIFSKINRPAWRLNVESCAENNF